MERDGISRREAMLAAAVLAAQAAWPGRVAAKEPKADRVRGELLRHAQGLPEKKGSNHYPMAADALIALGRSEAVPGHLRRHDGRFHAKPGAGKPLEATQWDAALGRYGRHGAWLATFRGELAQGSWQAVLRRWVPRLAPGLIGAAFHGLLRTAHATRGIGRRDDALARAELAAGLAYWAARYLELPTRGTPRAAGTSFERAFAGLDHPWLDREIPPVHYFSYEGRRLRTDPFAPPVRPATAKGAPAVRLAQLVRASALYFTQMARARRNGILLLHAVTGPASVQLLLPHLDTKQASRLVEYAWQAAAAAYAAFGSPYKRPRAVAVPPWKRIVERAVKTNDAHAIKLTEAVRRFDGAAADPRFRQAAWTWLA